MIVAQGTLLALIGISVGLAAALSVSRLLSSLLFGVDAADPAILGATGAQRRRSPQSRGSRFLPGAARVPH